MVLHSSPLRFSICVPVSGDSSAIPLPFNILIARNMRAMCVVMMCVLRIVCVRLSFQIIQIDLFS